MKIETILEILENANIDAEVINDGVHYYYIEPSLEEETDLLVWYQTIQDLEVYSNYFNPDIKYCLQNDNKIHIEINTNNNTATISIEDIEFRTSEELEEFHEDADEYDDEVYSYRLEKLNKKYHVLYQVSDTRLVLSFVRAIYGKSELINLHKWWKANEELMYWRETIITIEHFEKHVIKLILSNPEFYSTDLKFYEIKSDGSYRKDRVKIDFTTV